LVTVGSGGQVIAPLLLLTANQSQSLYIFQHNVPGRWYAQAAILAGGMALRWLRDLLGLAARPDAYAYLSDLAAKVPAGAEGLLFLPYLAGERTPHLDPAASGVFLGLRLHHQAGHLARAVMEGVGFALKECLLLISSATGLVTLSGGITRSATWCQILADIFGQPIHVAPANVPRACLGSAILAGVGSGVYRDFREALARRAETTTAIEPTAAEKYRERFDQYRRLYPLLQDEMHHLQDSK
jgi:xylulokinase